MSVYVICQVFWQVTYRRSLSKANKKNMDAKYEKRHSKEILAMEQNSF